MIMNNLANSYKKLSRGLLLFAALLCILSVSCKKTVEDEDQSQNDGDRVFITRYSQYTEISIGRVVFNMNKVQGGTFQMGTTVERDNQAQLDERIVHDVTLSDYFIGETEVTQALWDKVITSNPSNFKGSALPVENVSYRMVVDTFIPKLNYMTGLHFRLPTEAEWEFAARGGTNTQDYRYSGSNSVSEVAWYQSNSDRQTHPVKGKAFNELFLCDMSGNVGEWCNDWYDIYTADSQTNPKGPTSGSHRVVRGGSWVEGERYVRATCRMRYLPGSHNHFVGFRLAMDAE